MLTLDQATIIGGHPREHDTELDAEFPLGSQVGEFNVGPMLGAGSVGSAYRAHHRATGEEVVVKVLHADAIRRDDGALQRFAREAQVVAFSGCRHVVEVRDVGRLRDGRPYFVMEALRGVPLPRLVSNRGPLPSGKALAVIKGVAQALRCAHRLRIVHADLRPSNIFIADRGKRIVVLDFGISKILATRATGGTWPIPPETHPSIATDIFGLAALALYLLTGAVPPGDALDEYFQDLAEDGDVNPLAVRVVRRAMRPRPEERHQTPADFLDSLRRALKASTPPPTPVPEVESRSPASSRRAETVPDRPQRMLGVYVSIISPRVDPDRELISSVVLSAALRLLREHNLKVALERKNSALLVAPLSGDADRDDHRRKALIRAAKMVIDRTRAITPNLAAQITIAERRAARSGSTLRGPLVDTAAWVANTSDGEGVYLAPDLLARMQANTVQ